MSWFKNLFGTGRRQDAGRRVVRSETHNQQSPQPSASLGKPAERGLPTPGGPPPSSVQQVWGVEALGLWFNEAVAKRQQNPRLFFWQTVLACVPPKLSPDIEYLETSLADEFGIIIMAANTAVKLDSVRQSLENNPLYVRHAKRPLFMTRDDIERALKGATCVAAVCESTFRPSFTFGSASASAALAFRILYEGQTR